MAGENNRKHGYQGQVELDGSTLASVSKWDMDNKADRAEVLCFGDAHKKYVQGARDMQGTIEGFIDPDSASPADGNVRFLEACKAGTVVTLKLLPDGGDSSDYYSGGAVLDVKISVAANGAVTFAGTWAAAANGADWAGAGLYQNA